MPVDINEVLAAAAAIGAAALAVAGVVKFKPIRSAVIALLSETPHSLKESLESLSSVVHAQGESIAWLRDELEAARVELAEAKAELAEAKQAHAVIADLAHEENSKLRQRVAELEEQVRHLEAELARRRKYTPKAYRTQEGS
jgi:uncharacterized protein (DUF3084 family)